MSYIVSRGRFSGNPDVLMVFGDHGELCVFEPMQPHNMFSLRNDEFPDDRPSWFYTGSPHGPEIIGMVWERHAQAQLNKVW